jgi:hypothetical protein
MDDTQRHNIRASMTREERQLILDLARTISILLEALAAVQTALVELCADTPQPATLGPLRRLRPTQPA